MSNEMSVAEEEFERRISNRQQVALPGSLAADLRHGVAEGPELNISGGGLVESEPAPLLPPRERNLSEQAGELEALGLPQIP